MKKILVFSDPHYGHSNIIRHCNRPFWKLNDPYYPDEDQKDNLVPDVHLMNKVITDNINEVADVNDEVHCLGDWAFRGQNADVYRKNIRCRNINLILGNHDDHNISKYKTFQSVQHYKELHYKGKLIVMFHYPLRSWRNSNHGSIHLFGHVHGNMPGIGRSIDVGVDSWDFKPILLDDLIDKLEQIPLHKDYAKIQN